MKNLLPTSFEVTFIPLILAYVLFFFTVKFGLAAPCFPAGYLLIAFFFIFGDDAPASVKMRKAVFSTLLIAPMVFFLVWWR